MHGLDEEAVGAEFVQDLLPHPRHGAHGDGDVGGVGELHADRGERRADRAHAEGHDVEGAPPHRAAEDALLTGEDLPHLGGRLPVVGRARVLLLLGADEGAVLHAGDVARVGGGVVGVRAQRRVQLREGALVDELLAQPLVLGFGAVAPDHTVRLGESRDLVDPGDELLVPGGKGEGAAMSRATIAPCRGWDSVDAPWGFDPDASTASSLALIRCRPHSFDHPTLPPICPEGLTCEHGHSESEHGSCGERVTAALTEA